MANIWIKCLGYRKLNHISPCPTVSNAIKLPLYLKPTILLQNPENIKKNYSYNTYKNPLHHHPIFETNLNPLSTTKEIKNAIHSVPHP